MAYISAIAVDFGSTNSGCARIHAFDQDGKLKYATPETLHSDTNYAKDNTWFYIEPSFLNRLIEDFDSVKDSEFRIESRMLHAPNPNIIWGREPIRLFAAKLADENWTSFKNFKMLLRDGVDDALLDFPLVQIIKIFLRILKIECLEYEKKELGHDVKAEDICWGVTIPAIWDDANKRIMSECVHSVFTNTTRILSEPEGPLVANLLMSGNAGRVEFDDGRTSLVIDLGGGTTDICLMKEVKQSDGNFKIEMIANSDGSAAGGNDVDRDFYLYMLRTISKGKTSDAGIAYDTMDDDTLFREVFDGFRADISGFIEFDNNWLKLKSQRNLTKQPTCDFTFTSQYKKWLEKNGHKQLADKVRDLLVDGCEFPSDEFRKQVLDPTFDRICEKVAQIIRDNMDAVSFDAIVLAGGMSLNYALTERLKETVSAILGSAGLNAIKEATGLKAGSSIMTGTCFLLVNRGIIERRANRTYFYDSLFDTDGCLSGLKNKYANLGLNVKMGELNSIFDDEVEKGYKINIPGQYVLLSPVAVKDSLVKSFVAYLNSRQGQTKVSIDFSSSDGKIVIFANYDNPDLRRDGKIEVACEPETDFELEVDFNEGQISNDLHYILRESETGKILAEDYIRGVIE